MTPPGNVLLLEDPLQPLVPRSRHTEQDEDRLHALAHFSAGRAFAQRKEYAKAIRHYQRALRYDPSAKNVVWSIVALAEQLKWNDVRDRYLLKAAKLDPDSLDPADLIELVDLVSSEEEVQLVTRLLEKAIADRRNEKKSPLDIVLRWRLAEVYVARKDYGKATDCAAGVLGALENPAQFGLAPATIKELFGLPHPPFWLFGEYFLLADRLAEAEAIFEKAHQKRPDAGLLHFCLARIDAKRKRPNAALKHLEACFREDFDEAGKEPYRLLKEVLVQLGRGDELFGRLEKLLAKNPENVPLAYFAAHQNLEAGRLDKAAALYTSLLKKRPTTDAYSGLIKIYRKTGQIEALLRTLGEAAGQSTSLDNLGGQIKAITADAVLLDKLLAVAKKRLAKEPTSFGAHTPLAMAILATESKRLDVIDPFFELALQATPDKATDVLLLWGGAWMGENQFAKAADVFRRGAEGSASDDEKPMLYYYLATAYEMDGQTEKALEATRKACQLSNSPVLASNEAWILYHAERNQQAREVYAKFVERFDADHSSAGVRRVLREARLVLSHLEVEHGDEHKAEQWLEEVLDEFPDDVSAMNDLGYLWSDQGLHPERSLRMIQAAVKAEPDNAAYCDSLGWALFQAGRLQEAVVILEKAAGDLPDGEILDHLGEVYLKLGKPRQAVDVWRKAAAAYRKANQPETAAAVETKIKGAVPD
ncbi:MAG: tetratricopeptide repeat protein [Pirellulales bacterium]|nr:tetratricopeptide repeat protein [Pirellulales bacterium]